MWAQVFFAQESQQPTSQSHYSVGELTDLTTYNEKQISSHSELCCLDVDAKKLTSLQGIEKINADTPIQLLFAGNNNLQTLRGIESLTKLKKLYANHNRLTTLSKLSRCKKIKELALDHNCIETLVEVADGKSTRLLLPKGLETLHLNDNKLTAIPSEFCVLTILCSLSIQHNTISELPKDFTQLHRLMGIHFSHNLLRKLPDNFAEIGRDDLASFRYYDFSANNIQVLPEKLGDIQRKHEKPDTPLFIQLILNSNRLQAIPTSISALHSLATLDLSNNYLTEFPLALCACINLQRLLLANNQINKIPLEVTRLAKLQRLSLLDNPIETKVPKKVYSFLKKLEAKKALCYGDALYKTGLAPELIYLIYSFVGTLDNCM
ncbi:hypothetical protein Noda2021_09770 [Candidatus Dependentiae bacterium Noda2021]|nr:hypothetical protein Noda2021_09770 [Candidatus Dependentiae bacterium Noda2021]